MSLAAVQVSTNDFQMIHHHLTTFSRHQNMHLRETRSHMKAPVLRYLHAMYATSLTQIDGALSGPQTFWRYQLVSLAGQTQLRMLTHTCSPKDDTRLGNRFLGEIRDRMLEEQNAHTHYDNRRPGRFYLQRSSPGMTSTDPKCQLAVSSQTLDARFVGLLAGWNLKLVYR